ncbi:Hypothetical predicted protein [Pelobates cultripes]|uniref:Uncharacterized protein n=1 Tax=Pelobates cultripes TaxID=61616 RepID=A0AAD1RM34_PELCU|nr:Hypothetical predicted protein [Pelobates cultripes]
MWDDVQALLTSLNITTPLTGLSPGKRQLAAMTMLAARNLIANNWKTNICPPLTQLKHKIQQFYVSERMSLNSPTKTLAFEKISEVWRKDWTKGGVTTGAQLVVMETMEILTMNVWHSDCKIIDERHDRQRDTFWDLQVPLRSLDQRGRAHCLPSLNSSLAGKLLRRLLSQ